MVRAICRACRWSTIVAQRLPGSCDRCESPFFWYVRIETEFVLTEADRVFLRSGGIAADDVPAADHR